MKRIISRREEDLRHALRNCLEAVKLQNAAVRVRIAKLQLLKALCHSFRPRCAKHTSTDSRLMELRIEGDFCQRRSIDSIINDYTNTRHPSEAFDAKDAVEKVPRDC
jgi:hypothetical protein